MERKQVSFIPIINILSPHVADLIAAGEVVERPASAVKELVENAIDAHARNITVEIRAGGMKAIRVTDDGCGMSPEDAGIAFLRHATSKLHDADGLSCIATLGFRGEALAAIAAVSHITLLTRAKGESTGTRLRLCAGEIEEMTPAGCPEGTSISVEDLFYNTPARLKFMKSDRAEGSACAAAAPRRDFYQTMSAAAFRERTGQAEPQTARAPAPFAPEQTRMTLHQEAVPYGTSRTVPRPELPQTRPAAPQMQAEPDEKAAASGVSSAQAEPEAAPAPAAPEDYRVIGEVMNTYIIVEAGDALLLIDKHACHERIIFDRVSAGLGAQMRQTLLVPVTYSPGAGAVELLERNLPLLEEAGFVLERFGEDGVIIRAVPADTDGSEIAMLEEILNTLQTGRGGDPREIVCHTIACKAAIKAGSRSDPAELDALAARVVSGEIRYCPHGRPVAVRLTRRELDKQFKRIV